MRVRIALVLVLLAALTGSAAATSGAAAAPLDGLHGAGWIVADDAHGQVFVTGSPTSANTQVAVLGLDGSRTGTITQQGAAGMAVAGGTLWVAGCNTKQIVGYDLTTLAVTDTITTGRTLRFPCDLDAAAGKLWFDEPATDAGSSDALPASVTIAAPHTETSFAGTADPIFTTDPAKATRLLMTSMNGSPNTFDLWDTRTDPPSPIGSASDLGTGLGNDSSAITPDGRLLWALHGGGLAAYKVARIDHRKIVDQRTNRGSAEALAITADGTHIAAGVLVSSHPGIDVFGAAQSPVHSETFDETGADVVGLAFTHDASRLFVVDQPSDGAGTPYLHVIESPTIPASQVELNALGTAPAGSHVALSGRLSLEDGAAVDGDHVAVIATRPDATQVVVGSATVNAAGGFAIDSGELDLAGTWTFTATYPGDTGHGASSASGMLTVTPFPTSLSVTTSAAQIVAGQTVTVTAHLTGAPGGNVTVYRTVGGVKYLVGTHATDGDGDASFPLKPGRRTLYTAVYAGDANHKPSTAEGRTVTVQPHLTATISHGYKTLGGYHYYHYNPNCPARAANCPLFVITAFPNMSGRTVFAVVQELVGGTWKTAATFHANLGTMSHATLKIRYANRGVIGHQFRVVAQYRGSTDWAAVTWGYWPFRVTT